MDRSSVAAAPLRLVTLAVVLVALLGSLAGSAPTAAAQATREGTVRPGEPFRWDGAMATGANVGYDPAAGEPCGTTPADRCDVTLLHVDVAPSFWSERGGGVEVAVDEFRPVAQSDFDLYVYRSDGDGRRGALVASSADVPGAPEAALVDEASGHYLVQVVYYAVTESRYTGTASFVTRPAAPPDVDDPPGLQGHLASDPSLGFRSRSEPHIAQSPTDPDVLVAASKLYNRDPDSLAEYEFKVGTYVSFDGGRTWGDLGQTAVCPLSQAPPESWPDHVCYPADDPARGGTGPEDVDDPADPEDPSDPRGSGDVGEEYIVSDPWVQFDDEGNAYLLVLDAPPFEGLVGEPVSREDFRGFGMTLHRWESVAPGDLETGETWSGRIPINAYDTDLEQDLFLDDKNTLAVNNAGPDRDGTTGTMVACWGQNVQALAKQQIVCERSTDGGRTWPDEPRVVSPPTQQLVIGVHVVADPTDPDGFVAAWLHYTGQIVGSPLEVWVARSRDGGRTWPELGRAAELTGIPRQFPRQGFRNLSLPIMAAAPDGSLYITYSEYLPAPRPGDDEDGMQADIRLITSRDGGTTWSGPVTVNQDGTNADQFQPVVAAPEEDRVEVAFFDRRHDPLNFFIDQYLARSTDGGRTWTETRLSHDLWDPSVNPPISTSGDFIGDYQGLVADECRSVALFNDTHLANDPTRDPGFDRGLPRSRFQEVFAWVVPTGACGPVPAREPVPDPPRVLSRTGEDGEPVGLPRTGGGATVGLVLALLAAGAGLSRTRGSAGRT